MQHTTPISSVASRTGTLPALAAIGLGLSILFCVAFLNGPSAAVHNSAHDTRHSLGFVCH